MKFKLIQQSRISRLEHLIVYVGQGIAAVPLFPIFRQFSCCHEKDSSSVISATFFRAPQSEYALSHLSLPDSIVSHVYLPRRK